MDKLNMMGSPSLRLFGSVVVRCDDRRLLLHRNANRKIAPGKWGPVGGHLEAGEMREPLRGALRELREEAGIERLDEVGLRYVMISPRGGELHVYFTYVAHVSEEPELAPCGEGTLHWVPLGEVMGRELTDSLRATMEHYLAQPDDKAVKMGIREGVTARWQVTQASPMAAFRPAAGILARCGVRMLLLRRPVNKQIAPGMWANVGGHMEPEEIRDPAATALREFEEEAGIAPDRFLAFAFRSALLVAKPSEFGMLFGYTATLEEEVEIPDSEEDGSFLWVHETHVEALPMTPAMKAMALIDSKRKEAPQLGLVRGEEVRLLPWEGFERAPGEPVLEPA